MLVKPSQNKHIPERHPLPRGRPEVEATPGRLGRRRRVNPAPGLRITYLEAASLRLFGTGLADDRRFTHADVLRCFDAAMAEAHKPWPTVRPD
jgi:hypothetical protein